MINLVARAPFPEIPGAGALGIDHLGAPGRNNAEPRLFTAALADLDRDQGREVRPIIWRDALEACDLARRDLADAFAHKGLIYWQGGERWTLKGRPASLDRVCREFWPPFLAAVLADLNRNQEMPGAALARVRCGLQARWADAEEKREREHRAYLSRAFWPVPLAVFWICDGDYRRGLEWMADPERSDLAVYGDVTAQIYAIDAQIAIDLDESAPLEQLLRAAVSIPGLLSARVADQPDYRPVDVRHIESGAFRFKGELCERARAGDVEFADVCIDREKLWQAFPHPAVTLMRAVRLMWERHDRLAVAVALIELTRLVWERGERRRVAVAIMEEVALLWSGVGQEAQSEAARVGSKPRGRTRARREIIKAAIRDLIEKGNAEPSPARIRAHLKAKKTYPDGKNPDDATIATALEEVRAERAAAGSAEANNPVIEVAAT